MIRPYLSREIRTNIINFKENVLGNNQAEKIKQMKEKSFNKIFELEKKLKLLKMHSCYSAYKQWWGFQGFRLL